MSVTAGLLLLLGIRAIAKRESDYVVGRIIIAGFVAKLGATFGFHYVFMNVYEGSGDTNRYYNAGRRLSQTIAEGELPAEATATGTPFMEFLAGLLMTVTGENRLLANLVFSLLAFVGMYLMVKAFQLAVPDGDQRRYAALILLVPTMLFWTSTLGKEAWLVLALGLAANGAARVLRRARGGYLLVALGVAGAYVIRPHIAALIAAAIAGAYVLRHRDPEVRRGTAAWVLGLLLVGVGAGAVMTTYGDELADDHGDHVQQAEQIADRATAGTAQGESQFENRPVTNPFDFLHAAVTVPFRPFPHEAHNLQAQLAGLEGLALLVLTLASLPRIASLRRRLLRQPYTALATTYTVGFIIAFSYIANFGLLMRQRVQLLPFLFVLLCLPVSEGLQRRTRGSQHRPTLDSHVAPIEAASAPSTTDGAPLLRSGATRGLAAPRPPRVLVPVGAADGDAGSGPPETEPVPSVAASDSREPTATAEAGTSGPSGPAADPTVPRAGGGPPATPPPGRPASADRPAGGASTPAGQRVARALLAAVLLLIPLGGGIVALDLVTVRSSLTDARASLQALGGALGDVDVAEARVALAQAEDEMATARSRAGSLRWSVASVLPIVGHTIDESRQVVETSDAAVELGGIALREGERLIGSGLDIDVADGRLDLAPLLEAREIVDQLPIERLALARAELARPPQGWVPEQLLDGRGELLDLSGQLLDTVTAARGLTTALPGFLGTEEPRRYFVGMQTSAELRGTGGLIGFWGVLAIDDGHATFGQSEVYESDDDGASEISRLGGPYGVGVEADEEFTQRYAHLLGTSSFSNVNLEPDLPSTARVALDLYAFRTQERLDGMILLDPAGLQQMLEATGSELPIDAELASTLGLEDDHVPTDGFAQLVTADIYEVLGSEQSSERKEALKTIGDAALAQVLDGRWDGVEMARAMAAASGDRQLQVFSEYGREQAAFTEVGVTGELRPSDDSDRFAVTANNAVGGKQDVHLGHEIGLDLYLDTPVRFSDGQVAAGRSGTLEVTVDNPLPSSGRDEYVIGNCFVVGGRNDCFEGPPGWNWTWFNTWMPPDTQVLATRSADDSLPPTGPTNHRGLRVLDQFHATPPESRSTFGVDLAGTTPLTETTDGLVYEWEWWRQAKAIPDLLDVQVHAPDGWRIADAELAGGGSGEGAGVHGGGESLTVEVTDGVVHLHGTVTAHTALRIQLAPAS